MLDATFAIGKDARVMQELRPLEIYLVGKNRGEFARRIGCSPSHLTLVAQGKRGTSLELALNIERESDRAVTVEQLLHNKIEAAE